MATATFEFKPAFAAIELARLYKSGLAIRRQRAPRCFGCSESFMAFTQAAFRSYDFNRMVVLFTVQNDETEVPCAISTDALDGLDRPIRTKPEQREAQFVRLSETIRAHAEAKFANAELEGNPPGIILRSIDFRK
jgi:hypothetical protein